MSKVELTDEDLAAMLAAGDEYAKIAKRTKPKNSVEIFRAGFHFGVAHARGATTAPALASVPADAGEGDDEGGDDHAG